MKTHSRGFTLIELLVVIAIIGILASVVLASLNSARDKAADSAIKANLNGIKTEAELIINNTNPPSYAGVCADLKVRDVTNAAAAKGPDSNGLASFSNTVGAAWNVGICHARAASWVVSISLSDSTASLYLHWCVDSTGFSALDTTPVPGSASGGNAYTCD